MSNIFVILKDVLLSCSVAEVVFVAKVFRKTMIDLQKHRQGQESDENKKSYV